MDIREYTHKNENIREGTDALTVLKRVLCELIYAGAAFTLGRAELPFATLPFGFAALSASGAHALSAFVGLCLSLIGQARSPAYFIAYALVLLWRAVVSVIGDGTKKSISIFNEHVSHRVIACAVGVFSLGLYRLSTGGFLYYDLFSSIIGICVCSAFVLFFYVLEYKRAGGLAYAISLVALLCALTWGLRGIDIYGIDLNVLFAMLATLAVTRRLGLLQGTLTSLATGLCVSFEFAPLFVFGAVLYTLLGAVTPFFGAVASFGVGMAWGIYIDGISAISTLLPALLASNLIFFVVDRLYISSEKQDTAVNEQVKDSKEADLDHDLSLARLNDQAGRIKLLCEGFSSLSDMLIRADVAESQERLSYEVGELPDDTDGALKMTYYSTYLADSLRSAALAAELKAVSEYLSGIMVQSEGYYFSDIGLSESIRQEIEKEHGGVSFSVRVYGEGKKRIMVFCNDGGFLEKSSQSIKRVTECVCQIPLSVSEVSEIDGRAFITLERSPCLEAVFAGRKRNSKGEEEFCGDSFGVISEQGHSYAFISDGMGSGREAAVTSGLCTLFLQKLLPINNFAGDCANATLEALNGFLCSRNGAGVRECASTVDMVSLDLIDCKAVFYKCGAAPTYIFRDGALFKIQARTIPIGIVKRADIGKINMELLPNDVIVMVSDGVTQGREECPELFELLRTRVLTHNAEQLADAVMEYAERQGCSDDVSVLVAKIQERDLPIIK